MSKITEKFDCKGFFKKSLAFTLAEILVTLGIIGVIAAITIPNLIITLDKRRAEMKLKRFYAEINQAIKLSALQTNVDVDGWVFRNKEYKSMSDLNDFIDTYLRPCLNILYVKEVAKNKNACSGKCPRVLIVLQNGIAFSFYIDGNGGDVFFHPDPDKTDYKNPRESFAFQMAKKTTLGGSNFVSVDSIEPYTMNWNGKMTTLKTDNKRGCNRKSSSNNQYCTKWIQMNGWKIPNDYPW